MVCIFMHFFRAATTAAAGAGAGAGIALLYAYMAQLYYIGYIMRAEMANGRRYSLPTLQSSN